jgi:hypothetical protein
MESVRLPRLVAEGKRTREIAELLGVSVKTAESHRTHITKKLGISQTAGLVRYALQRGLSQLQPSRVPACAFRIPPIADAAATAIVAPYARLHSRQMLDPPVMALAARLVRRGGGDPLRRRQPPRSRGRALRGGARSSAGAAQWAPQWEAVNDPRAP